MSDETDIDVGHRLVSQLRLGNFKSVADQTVDLKPLTVVVGANSAGKSTLTQALLLVTQAVESSSPGLDVALNADRVSLGFLDAVRNQRSKSSAPVHVGLTADVHPSRHGFHYWLPGGPDSLDGVENVPWRVLLDVEFGGSSGQDVVTAPVKHLSMRVHRCDQPDNESELLSVQFSPRDARQPSSEPLEAWPAGPYFGSQREATAVSGTAEALSGGRVRISGVGVHGLLPFGLYRERAENRAVVDFLFDFLDRFRGPVPADIDAVHIDEVINGFVDTAVDLLNQWKALDVPKRPSMRFYLHEELDWDHLLPFASSIIERRSALTSKLLRSLDSSDNRKLPVSLRGAVVHLTSIASESVRDLLHSVDHLGGLRAAPQPLYPTSQLAQRGDIGRDGEYTAAVLYALRNREVVSFDEDGHKEALPLAVAVQRWASRLGLFEEVDPHHRGALGFDIGVRQQGLNEQIDITGVGVGVSQLLPVLVRCILSAPGDVVVLEQPELHLHPRSQQHLADFLLACVRSGRQLIVETHSEHLINRLRLHAASDDSAEVADLITLVFAERDNKSGETTYQNVSINPFGGLTEWPEGFMDSGISDARQLLEIGARKLELARAQQRK